ncbi:glycosyltransferase family 2 protein [Erythrobacter ani]|uniref:Glycosyltransferase family 2 protein n=1 Tax=Erythrobacter ani TaxID=2827235 RepID=A0ABS6SNB6_9SPHN|nr:glycosyltransferase family 2 protein [Erythrobacter ani]MBV7266331.1 glycosyltransferase family 2 protein [Erythrobacter ani]
MLIATRPDRLIAVGWWKLIGKKLRARYRFEDAIAAMPFAHERWLHDCGQVDRAEIEAAKDRGRTITICVHLHLSGEDDAEKVRATLASIRDQSVPGTKVLITSEEGATGLSNRQPGGHIFVGTGNSRADGVRAALLKAQEVGIEWLIPVAVGDALPRHAVAAYTAHVLRHTGNLLPAVLYGDQDEFSPRFQSANAWLKPEFDRRMLWSQDYVSRACALLVGATLPVIQGEVDRMPQTLFELIAILAISLPDGGVEHVPRATARTASGQWCVEAPSLLAAIGGTVAGFDTIESGPFGTVQLRWPLPATHPLVSIIVATRDRVELLKPCVDGVLNDTDYSEIEVIIVDNDSRDSETLEYMESAARDHRVRVVRWPHPFNYSAINNFGATFASGEYFCLLNNDIEIVEPQWLTELLREASRPGVGAVGARLLYPDRSIQHAGVAIGIGNAAGHAHRGLIEGDPGYYAQALVARGASAVTAACLLLAKEHFDAVGGLDEEHLAVAYNDVDLCLKLRERGLQNIYTPAATLIHHESKSRGQDYAPENLERFLKELECFQQRWNTRDVIDPWHHPALNRSSEVYR